MNVLHFYWTHFGVLCAAVHSAAITIRLLVKITLLTTKYCCSQNPSDGNPNQIDWSAFSTLAKLFNISVLKFWKWITVTWVASWWVRSNHCHPSLGRGSRSFVIFFSQVKSFLKCIMYSEHLIVAHPSPWTPAGRCPCLIVITSFPAISSSVACSITAEVGQCHTDTIIRFLTSYV